ncbi:activity-regulated cytoskeleton associated protein 2-like [Arctopsyche grandis]|uniref:activity-regulated cytoskeleton associated protein 2-like n=1 Tax=Arctopsyche grandis TaxID=121162 RepID=UPI00406D6F9E
MYTVKRRIDPEKNTVKGGFELCKLKFNGDNDVEEFISGITIYKIVNKIDDATANRDLHLVLDGKAARWWSSIKSSEFLWTECTFLLRSRFSNKMPINVIYQKLKEKQSQNSSSTYFIAKKRALIANLPESFSEMYQVKIVTDLLKKDIKNLIKRGAIATFKDLYDEVEVAESILKSKHRSLANHVKESTSVKKPRKLKKNYTIQKNKAVKCSHCFKYSHPTELCWNKIKSKCSTSLQIRIVNENYNANTFIESVLNSRENNLKDTSQEMEVKQIYKHERSIKHESPGQSECDLRDVLNRRTIDFANDIEI